VTRRLIALVLFGVAFGYVEAAVVVYLRTIDAPLRRDLFREVDHDAVFPLLSLEQLHQSGPEYMVILRTELGRELATLVMLGALGMMIGGTFRQWLAGFVVAFGVWDIFYYVFLQALIGWPGSLWTWDILFLLPVPWVGPVIAPVIVSATMITAGGMTLWRESRGRPVLGNPWDYALITAGGLVMIVAFCWDFRHTSAGGWPHPFNWPLLGIGEATAVAGFVRALGR
jgi:hypothetical protein